MTQNVLVFVFNSLGKVWIHRRPDNKRYHPGLWDISACGGIISGETPLQAAHREQEEEMGITCDLTHVDTFLNSFPSEDGKIQRRLSYVFIGNSDEVPQPNEDAVAFASIAHDSLARIVRGDEESYVPSFLVEYERAHTVCLQMLGDVEGNF